MKQKILDLIIDAKRTDPETGSFSEWLAEYLVANGVTVQKPISVLDRLPEENGRYLCNIESMAFPGRCYWKILWYDKDGFVDGNIIEDGVTHWMPIPDPPRKDGV